MKALVTSALRPLFPLVGLVALALSSLGCPPDGHGHDHGDHDHGDHDHEGDHHDGGDHEH